MPDIWKNRKSWGLRMAPDNSIHPTAARIPKHWQDYRFFAKTSQTTKLKYMFGAWIALDEYVCVLTERYLYLRGSRSLDKQVVYVFGARGRLRRRVSCMDGVCSLYTLRQSRRRKIQPHSQSLFIFLCFRWNGVGTGGSVDSVDVDGSMTTVWCKYSSIRMQKQMHIRKVYYPVPDSV